MCFIPLLPYKNPNDERKAPMLRRAQARYRKSLKNTDRRLLWAYNTRNGHKRRVSVLFSREELYLLSKQTEKCVYCGINLTYLNTYQGNAKETASLDNRDLKNVLTINDVDIICYSCNRTKSNRTQEEFLNYCKGVVESLGVLHAKY